MNVQELINAEVDLYVQFCSLAALHDDKEVEYKQSAHVLFYHIQEMRSTGQVNFMNYLPSFPGKVRITPIR